MTTGGQLFTLTASDAAVGAWFGNSVAISGNTAIIGSSGNGHAGFGSGSAYLFDVTTGRELFKLTASDAAAQVGFGGSVAIDGNTAIVGAYANSDAGPASGSAYLFDVTTGQEIFKLTASDAAESDIFGASVAISGNTAIVGGPQNNDDARTNSGSAYLFDVTTGNELFKLTASDAAELDRSGLYVGISGDTVIVGSYRSTYMFDVTTGNELFKLGVVGPVGISGNTAIVRDYLFTSSSPSSDLTGNGFVDFEDLTVLLANWNRDVGAALGNLVSPDDTPVNFEDLTVLLADWTGPAPGAALAAVPEPSSLLLALFAALALVLHLRKWRRGARS